MKLEYLEQVLDTERVSVTGNLTIKRTKDGKPFIEMILALKVRNVGRDEIDLWSIASRCVNLEDNGCYFDITKRPSGGIHLIAEPHFLCHPDYDLEKELEKWKPYQTLLRKLVKRRTGMTLEAKLRQDIENAFYDLMSNNYPNSNEVAINNALKMTTELMYLYPKEFEKARIRFNGNKNTIK